MFTASRIGFNTHAVDISGLTPSSTGYSFFIVSEGATSSGTFDTPTEFANAPQTTTVKVLNKDGTDAEGALVSAIVTDLSLAGPPFNIRLPSLPICGITGSTGIAVLSLDLAVKENGLGNMAFNPSSAGGFEVTLEAKDGKGNSASSGALVTPINLNVNIDTLQLASPTIPIINVSPSSLDFGLVQVASSKRDTVTLKSVGGDALKINGLSGVELPFSIVSPVTLPDALAPNSLTNVVVEFSPATAGSFLDTLVVTSNDTTNAILNIPLSGSSSFQLVINEVLFNPGCWTPTGTAQFPNTEDEFIEILNNGLNTMDIGGWTLSDISAAAPFAFPGGTTIDPGEFIVLFGDTTGATGFTGQIFSDPDNLIGDGLSEPPGDPDGVVLKTSGGVTVDSVFSSSPPTGKSLVRIPDGIGAFGDHDSPNAIAKISPGEPRVGLSSIATPDSIEIPAGLTAQLSALGFFSPDSTNITDLVIWSSSDASIAVVDDSGKVTAKTQASYPQTTYIRANIFDLADSTKVKVIVPLAPVMTSINPTSGTELGGTSVTIAGNNFRSGATVTFGDTAAAGVGVASSDTISATTPTHPVGTVDIIITNPSGLADTLLGGFTFSVNPVVTSIDPASGTELGGTSVTITGSGFKIGGTVAFDDSTATDVAVVSSNTITATTPAHPAGTVDVIVTNPDGEADTLSNGFTFVSIDAVTDTVSFDAVGDRAAIEIVIDTVKASAGAPFLEDSLLAVSYNVTGVLNPFVARVFDASGSEPGVALTSKVIDPAGGLSQLVSDGFTRFEDGRVSLGITQGQTLFIAMELSSAAGPSIGVNSGLDPSKSWTYDEIGGVTRWRRSSDF